MRWAVVAACLVVFALGILIIGTTPELECLPPGGRSIPYIGVRAGLGLRRRWPASRDALAGALGDPSLDVVYGRVREVAR